MTPSELPRVYRFWCLLVLRFPPRQPSSTLKARRLRKRELFVLCWQASRHGHWVSSEVGGHRPCLLTWSNSGSRSHLQPRIQPDPWLRQPANPTIGAVVKSLTTGGFYRVCWANLRWYGWDAPPLSPLLAWRCYPGFRQGFTNATENFRNFGSSSGNTLWRSSSGVRRFNTCDQKATCLSSKNSTARPRSPARMAQMAASRARPSGPPPRASYREFMSRLRAATFGRSCKAMSYARSAKGCWLELAYKAHRFANWYRSDGDPDSKFTAFK